MKARLNEGRLVKATNPLRANGRMIGNPTDEQLAELGYKEVIETEAPAQEEGYYFSPEWVEEADCIVRVWTKHEVEAEELEG